MCYRLLETICFSIGSAYFVTGSYPDGALVAGDNDYWNDFRPPEEEFEAQNPFFIDDAGGGVRTMHGATGVVGTSFTTAGYAQVPSGTTDDDNLNLTLLENDQLHHY